MEGLKLVIGGDVKPAEQALKAFVSGLTTAESATDKFGANLSGLEKQVAHFGGGVKKFSATFSTSFNALPPSIKKVEAALTKLPRASNAATLSLINLGRVAQDAPFGIIGIANNINPLLESFQRLRAESGSTGVAIKSLVGSLLGGGGLGLAVSVVTGLMSFFALQSRSAKDEVTEEAKAVDGAAEKHKAFIQAINGAAGSVLSHAKEIQNLRDILLSTDRATQQLTQSTINQGLARFVFDEKNIELQKIIAAQIEKQLILRKKIVGVGGLEEFTNDAQTINLEKQAKALNEFRLGGDLTKDVKRLKELNTIIGAAGGEINTLNLLGADVSNFFKQFLDGTKKAGDGTDDFINKAKQLNSELEKIGFIAPVEFSFFDTVEEEFKKAQKVFSDFATRNLKISPKVFTVDFLFSEPPPERLKAELTRLEQIIQSGVVGFPAIEVPVNVSPELAANADLIREFQSVFKSIGRAMPEIDLEMPAGFNQNVLLDSLRAMLGAGRDVTKEGLLQLAVEFKKGIDNINGIIKSLAVQGISGFAEAFGTALAGGDLRGIFTGFVNVLADGLSAIGKQMIALSPVITGLKAALKSLNPAILLPAGVALVAIGAALRATVGKGVTGFAQGGLVFGPTMGMVGEGLGTSRSNPEVIAPLDKLKGMLGGLSSGPQVIFINSTLRGDKFKLLAERTNRKDRRLGRR